MRKREINELKTGSILSYVNLIISTIIPLFYTPIMLRILGQAEYGLYSLSNSVISYLTLLNFGLGNAAIRFVTKYRVEDDHEMVEGVVGMIIFIFGIISIIVCVIGVALTKGSGIFFGGGLTSNEINKLKILMIIMTLSTAISFPISILGSISIAYEKYIFRKIVDGIFTILAPILNLIVLYMGFASIGMACIGLFTQIISGVIYYEYCRRKLKVIPRFHNMPFFIIKDVLGFSIFIFISSVIDMLYWATDKVLIGAMVGTTAVAVYNIGGTFTAMLQNMSSAISGVFATRVNVMVFSNQSMDELSRLLIRIGRLQYYIVSFMLSGYIVFGKVFIHFWAGDSYSLAYYVGLLTMIPLAVPLIQNIAFTVITAKNRLKFRSVVYAIVAICNIVGTIILLPKYGIIGAAVCTAFAFCLGHGVCMNLYYWKVTKLNIILFWKNILRLTFVPAIISVVFLNVFRIYKITSISYFVLFILVFSGLFLFASWFFSMNHYEKGLIKSLLWRKIQ